MTQIAVVETNQLAFTKQVNLFMELGYKLLVGSTYIVSLETDSALTNRENLGDVEHTFSVGISGSKEKFLLAKSLDAFVLELNKQLEHENVLVGSMFFGASRLSTYKDVPRTFVNYHACCLYKE